jgi:hypothetical protein
MPRGLPILQNPLQTLSKLTLKLCRNSICSSHYSGKFMESTSSFEGMPRGLIILQNPPQTLSKLICSSAHTQIMLSKSPQTLQKYIYSRRLLDSFMTPRSFEGRDNSLFDTEKLTHSFLGPPKTFLPYLTLS